MKYFPTDKSESFKTRLQKLLFNFFPAYRRTGGRIGFISSDLMEVHVSLRLRLSTRNYVGTVFGGSIYGALDPIYMIQLIHILGKSYIVWDKAATIRFRRPVRGKVFARFLISDRLLAEIRNKVATHNTTEILLKAQFEDNDGTVYAEVDKVIYISDRDYYTRMRDNSSASNSQSA